MARKGIMEINALCNLEHFQLYLNTTNFFKLYYCQNKYCTKTLNQNFRLPNTIANIDTAILTNQK